MVGITPHAGITFGTSSLRDELKEQGRDILAAMKRFWSLLLAVALQCSMALAGEPPKVQLGTNPQLGSGAHSLSFSEDGKELLVLLGLGGPYSSVRVWDVATASVVGEFQASDSMGSGLLLRDGRMFVVGDELYLGDGKDWKAWSATKPERRVFGIAPLPDGKTIALRTHEKVAFFDVESGKIVRELEIYGGALSMAFFPDGKTFVMANNRGGASIRDAADGKELVEISENTMQTDTWKRVAVSPDGRLVAVTEGKLVRILDPAGKELAKLEGHTGAVGALAFSPDGRQLATGGGWAPPEELSHRDYSVRLWDTTSWKAAHVILAHSGEVRALLYAPDGKTLVSGGDDMMAFWDPATGQAIRRRTGHKGRVTGVRFTNDGASVIAHDSGGAGGRRSCLKVWDRATGAETQSHDLPGIGELVGFAGDRVLLANGPSLAVVGLDGKTVRTIRHSSSDVLAAAFSPDRKLIASGNREGQVLLWDAEKPAMPRKVAEHSRPVLCLAFSGDGKFLAWSEAEGTVWIWDVAAGQSVATIEAGRENVSASVAFSRDSTRIVIAAKSDYLAIHEVATGKLVRKLAGAFKRGGAAIFAGETVKAAGRRGGAVVVFDAATGGEISRHELPDELDLLNFSPDGRFLATVDDRRFMIWDLGDAAAPTPHAPRSPGPGEHAVAQEGVNVSASDLGPSKTDTGSVRKGFYAFRVVAKSSNAEKKALQGKIQLLDASGGAAGECTIYFELPPEANVEKNLDCKTTGEWKTYRLIIEKIHAF